MSNKRTLLFDFDGVIHSYVSGWQGMANCEDAPVSGIKTALEELSEEFEIVVYSTRCCCEEGQLAIENYMKKHNLYYDRISDRKVPAYLTIDDRAINFDGNVQNMLLNIHTFKHYLV